MWSLDIIYWINTMETKVAFSWLKSRLHFIIKWTHTHTIELRKSLRMDKDSQLLKRLTCERFRKVHFHPFDSRRFHSCDNKDNTKWLFQSKHDVYHHKPLWTVLTVASPDGTVDLIFYLSYWDHLESTSILGPWRGIKIHFYLKQSLKAMLKKDNLSVGAE